MKIQTEDILNHLLAQYIPLACVKEDIMAAFTLLTACYRAHKKVLACGNGGSASDSEHIVGELMKGFRLPRLLDTQAQNTLITREPKIEPFVHRLQGGLRAMSLVSQTSIMTAIANDIGGDMIFAQQVYGYMDEGDVLVALSTSGNAQDVINAAITARAMNGRVISITGESGGALKEVSDVALCLPEGETYRVQEYTLPVYHMLCAMVESEFYA